MNRYQRLRDTFWILLVPLSWIWVIAGKLRFRWRHGGGYRSAYKTISVGNLHSGGTGKTPIVVELAKRYADRGAMVFSRGYRGSCTDTGGEVSIDLERAYELFGDEPCLIHEESSVPVFVGKDRVKQIKSVEPRIKNGIAILDDGFQHLKVQRDVDFVTIPTSQSPLAANVLPAGELREPLSSLNRADAILLTHASDENYSDEWREVIGKVAPGVTVFEARLVSDGLWENGFAVTAKEGGLGAFCGIAGAERFLAGASTRYAAIPIKAFSDHHDYHARDFEWLAKEAKRQNLAALVTTSKDAIKVTKPLQARGIRVFIERIRYELSNEFWYFLDSRLETA